MLKRLIATLFILSVTVQAHATITSIFTIPGGSNGDVQVNSSGTFRGLTLVAGTGVTVARTTFTLTISASGGTPGGSNSYVQFNNSSAFGADSGFTYDGAGHVASTGSFTATNSSASVAVQDPSMGVGESVYLYLRGGYTFIGQNYTENYIRSKVRALNGFSGAPIMNMEFTTMRNSGTQAFPMMTLEGNSNSLAVDGEDKFIMGSGTTDSGQDVNVSLSFWTNNGTGKFLFDGVNSLMNLTGATLQQNSVDVCLENGTNCPAAGGSGYAMEPSTVTPSFPLGLRTNEMTTYGSTGTRISMGNGSVTISSGATTLWTWSNLTGASTTKPLAVYAILLAGTQNPVRFGDLDDSNYVAFRAPAVVGSDITWTLPSTDSAGCFQSNGSGTVSLGTCGSGGGYFIGTATDTLNMAGFRVTNLSTMTALAGHSNIYISTSIQVLGTITVGSSSITITNAAGNLDGTKIANADFGDVSWSAGVATVDSVAAANVAAGALGPSVRASSFPVTGAVAGTYGSATQVATFTVNAQGMITAVGNITILAAGADNLGNHTATMTITSLFGVVTTTFTVSTVTATAGRTDVRFSTSVTVAGKLAVEGGTMTVNGVQYYFNQTFTGIASSGTFCIDSSSRVFPCPVFTAYYDYFTFGSPDTIPTTSSVTFETSAATSPAYGKANYQHAVSSQFNDSIFYEEMVRVFDNTVDLQLDNFAVMTGTTADTGTQRWVIDMSTFSNSEGLANARWVNAINIDLPADASAAAFDMQSATNTFTLTGWKSVIQAGAPFAIRVARDGDASPQDGSTQKAYLKRFKIRFGVTNP